ncbi:MAG: TRAP transporter small permease [Rhodoferax sp.]|nr:MAG: TRAP transporter small permease [Rhodoferax sp.]
MRWLEMAARLCALLGGVLMGLVIAMTCASVLGRNTTGTAITGDFELTGVATGMAIALFMPWCQLQRGHIIVDFFTAKASPKVVDFLDRLGSLALAMLMAVLAWRTSLGGINAWGNHSASMLMGVPDWLVYASMTPPLLLCALIALAQALQRGAPQHPGINADFV